MSDPIEIFFTDGNTGESVCLFARWGFFAGEDALFLAMMHHKERWDDLSLIAHATMRNLFELAGDEDETSLGISSTPGRSTEQIHVDFKCKMIRKVSMDYSKEIPEQTTVQQLWTFQEFYDPHRNAAVGQTGNLQSRYKA
jgi:hypothetical protein